MEDYLETIITILIGLGAFLISALRKRKPTEKKEKSAYEDYFDNDRRSEELGFEDDDLEDIETIIHDSDQTQILKHTAMREATSINDPPGQSLIDLKISDNSENEIYNLKEQKKARKKIAFDGKRAIIYSAIINRKHF
jgi:hypothetical protein